MKTKRMRLRLALREEGNFWNAYLAKMDTMDGARLIGSISIGAVHKHPEIKAEFMDLMKKVLGHAIEEVVGKPPEEWYTEQAPESERAGHG